MQAAVFRVAGTGAPPIPIFQTIIIEGDSITSNDPQTPVDFYSYAWANTQPSRDITVTADGSRTVGGAPYNGDLADAANLGENSLWGQRVNDLAFGPDLITAKIGVNDMGSTGVQVPTYIRRLKDWAAYIRANSSAKIAYGVPTPTAVGTAFNQAQVDAYMAKWNTLFTTQAIRNPANWSQWADYYIPMGEHPDFLTSSSWTIDGVHPTGATNDPLTGGGKLFQVYRAAMDTLIDQSRINAAGPYQSVWDAFGPFTDLAVGQTITRRAVVSGLAWAGSAIGVSVTGAGSPSVKTNGNTAPGWTYNGDVIDLTLTLSSSYETDRSLNLTIGGETRTLTFRTAANVAPATYVHGNIVKIDDPSNTISATVEDDGLQVIILRTRGDGTTVSIGGFAATRRIRDAAFSDYAIEIFEGPGEVGDAILATHPAGFFPGPIMSYGAILNGVYVAGSADGDAVLNESNPHETGTFTIPANGLAIGGIIHDTSAAPSAGNAGTTLEAYDYATY